MFIDLILWIMVLSCLAIPQFHPALKAVLNGIFKLLLLIVFILWGISNLLAGDDDDEDS